MMLCGERLTIGLVGSDLQQRSYTEAMSALGAVTIRAPGGFSIDKQEQEKFCF